MSNDAVPLQQGTEAPLPAGDFLDWLASMQRALARRGPSDVPCGDCTACCQGGYFIHVHDGERAAARIPAVLLFPAPGRSKERLLGHDAQGRCPMLKADACSIYPDRPASCRTYDCRIFAATGIAEPALARRPIMARAARWRFDHSGDDSREQHQALMAAARIALESPKLAGLLPPTATQLAMLIVSRAEPIVALARVHGLPLEPTMAVIAGLRAALGAGPGDDGATAARS